MYAALWLLSLPLRLVLALGFRRTVVLVCLVVLAVSLHSIAVDLGLVDAPAAASPRRPGRPPPPAGPAPSRAARADLPPGWLGLYQTGARQCPGLPWTVLAGVGKVESDHGRARLPGVRSGWNHAGAAGPMQFGIGVGRAGNAWARFGTGRRADVYKPEHAIPAAARYLCHYGAPRQLGRALFAYNHSWSYVALVKRHARAYGARP